MNNKELAKLLQLSLAAAGEKLTVDGVIGPKTSAIADKYDVTIAVKLKPVQPKPAKPAPVAISGDFFGAPWINVDLDLLGRDETDAELNARYVPEWAKLGLPGYKTLVGNRHAWCSVRCTKAFRQVGINVKGLTAGAASHSRFGYKSPFWFGCDLDIEHNGGGRHVCFFLYWIDEAKGICATLDGNRGNKFCVARTTLAKGHDRLVAGPRWPHDAPPGQLVTREQVLEKYPFLVPGNVGGGTR